MQSERLTQHPAKYRLASPGWTAAVVRAFRMVRAFRIGRAALIAMVCLLLSLSSGCASLTNPAVPSIPVRQVPPELLSSSRVKWNVPLQYFRRPPPTTYQLAPDDVLGIWIPGFVGDPNNPPPLNMASNTIPISSTAGSLTTAATLPPPTGTPVLVQTDGNVTLPEVGGIRVAGLTLAEAEQTIRRAFMQPRQLLPRGQERVVVTLYRPRSVRVLVMRQDSPPQNFSVLAVTGTGQINEASGLNRRGTSQIIELPAYENDVLSALTLSGGYPGLDAGDEVIIQRAGFPLAAPLVHEHLNPAAPLPGQPPAAQPKIEPLPNPNLVPELIPTAWNSPVPTAPVVQATAPADSTDMGPASDTHHPFRGELRVALRLPPGTMPVYDPAAVTLNSGDIVIVPARPTMLYFTAGLIAPGENVLPPDRDIDVLEAIARAQSPMFSGGINQSNLAGTVVAEGFGAPSPSLLTVIRKTPDGGQVAIRVDLNRAICDPRERILVQPNDLLLLQETPSESTVRYFTQSFSFNIIQDLFRSSSGSGTVFGTVP